MIRTEYRSRICKWEGSSCQVDFWSSISYWENWRWGTGSWLGDCSWTRSMYPPWTASELTNTSNND